MNLVVRVTSIRVHKSVSFLEVFNSSIGQSQIMLDNAQYDVKTFCVGDVIDVNVELVKNNRGNEVFKLDKINWVNHSQEWISPKSLNANMGDKMLRNQIEALNGGRPTRLFLLKQELIKEVSKILELDDFQSVKCQALEKERTGSGLPSIECKLVGNEKGFLRMTMENQLKQMCAMLLRSIYSIDTIFYDFKPGGYFNNEAVNLEFVRLGNDVDYLVDFINRINELMILLIEKYSLYDIELPPKIEIRKFSETNGNTTFVNPELRNTIVLNAPVESPFVKCDSKYGRTETRWYVNGHMMGHGYEDEVRYDKIKEVIDAQKLERGIEDADAMEYIKWGMPQTISFGLGFDILMKQYYGIERTIDAGNPMGINYKRN